jgi:hypothetical protein
LPEVSPQRVAGHCSDIEFYIYCRTIYFKEGTKTSFFTAHNLHEPDWGLPDAYISKIIVIEKMEDITDRFRNQIDPLCAKFGNVSRIRIASFDEKSGANERSKSLFKAFIASQRDVMYVADMSNKECCVLFLQNPSGIKTVEVMPDILAHEYAHHFQVAHAGFPYYFTKTEGVDSSVPSFSKPFELGSWVKEVFLDNAPLPESATVIDDALERISDIICEGILRERSVYSALEKQYIADVMGPDPFVPPLGEICKRYVHRLVLRDLAEWGACIELAMPIAASTILPEGRAKAYSLNKNNLNAYRAFDAVFKLCKETDFNLFKDPKPTLAYMQKVFDIIRIRLKPPLC